MRRLSFNAKRLVRGGSGGAAKRWFLLLALFGLLMLVTYIGTKEYVARFYEGEIALKDVYAPFDFVYTGDVDKGRTTQLKQKAAMSVRPVYSIDEEAIGKSRQSLELFLQEILKQYSLGIDKKEKISAIKAVTQDKISDETLSALFKQAEFGKGFADNIYILFDGLATKPIIDKQTKKNLQEANVPQISLVDPSTGNEIEIPVDNIISDDNLSKELEQAASKLFSRQKELKEAALEIAAKFIQPDLKENTDVFKKRREEAIASVPEAYAEMHIKRNELIIEKGKRVTKKEKTLFEELDKMLSSKSKSSYLLGMGMLILVLLGLGVLHIRAYDRKLLSSTKDLALLSILVLIDAVMIQSFEAHGFPSYLVPVASIAMLSAILLGPEVAFLANVLLSVFGGVIYVGRVDIVLMALVGGSIGIYSVKSVRKRSHIIKAGFFVGIANFLTTATSGFLNDLAMGAFLVDASLGFATGIASSFIVMGLLPFFEYCFKVTTDITLLELSDLNHPLLQEMILKAPATYHHSILVSNLAESAANAIGANSLLTRVGAYYHDIGKIGKPEYFNENESEFRSRHENLTPSMSALIITNHVKDGIELAKRYKISEKIIDFIRQHHGQGMVYYFYQRAMEQASDLEAGGKIDESVYRYPGPKPQTRETAIVLLADSAEAASRAIENPTLAKINGVVHKVISNKFVEGQLDECDLTLKDLNKIEDSFTRALNAIFHTRLNYDKKENNGK